MTPKITALRVRAAVVPRPRPLIFHTAKFTQSPLLLLDLETDAGVTGHAYLFCYHDEAVVPLVSMTRNMEPLIKGMELAPLAINHKIWSSFRYLGMQGIAAMVMSVIDMAAWDALARSAGLPLARLLGGTVKPLATYDSTGLGGPVSVAREAAELADAGFGTIKIKLGYASIDDDLAVIRAIGDEVPGMKLMVDYNMRLSNIEAALRMAALEPEGLLWVEEPLDSGDLDGHAALARDFRTPIQMGENWWSVQDMTRAVKAQATDCVMIDIGRIGGVTGWLQCAALAEAHGLQLSSHFFPEISAQMMCVTPTAHWLEFLEWASPILAEPVSQERGILTPSMKPGSGVEWDEAAVAKYEINV